MKIIETLEASFKAEIARRVMNVQIMLANPMAIHDHTDYMGGIESELDKIAEAQDRLEALYACR